MLKVWLLAAVTGAATTVAADAPPPELLEFVGDWSPQEQKLIDDASHAKPAPAAQGKAHEDEHADQKSPPPR